jgi:putative ABC transport system ATP-binding protein
MRNAGKTYDTPAGPVPVLAGVSVTVRKGDFMAITGPSGSGKTTFLNLAGLLDAPTAGSIRFSGSLLTGLDEIGMCRIRKHRVGLVFQAYHLLPARTVLENVVFRFRYLDHEPASAKKLSVQALEKVELAHLADKPVRLLSGGEMQRVAIARAIAPKPDLVLADEPTGNLDQHSADLIMGHFQDLNRLGITLILATHNMALLRYCNRHLVCAEGSIREEKV